MKACVFAGLFLMLVFDLPRSEQKSISKENQKESRKAPTPPSVSTQVAAPPTEPTAKPKDNRPEKEPENIWHEAFSPESWPNWALVLVGSLGIFVAIRTLNAMMRQADSMERQTKATEDAAKAAIDNAIAAKEGAEATKRSINLLISKERPRINVAPAGRVNFREGGTYKSIPYQIECICPSVAFIVTAEAGTCLQTPTGLNPIRQSYGIDEFENIHQTATLGREVLLFERIDDSTLNRFETGDLILFFYGRITYRGVHLATNEPPYVTDFC